MTYAPHLGLTGGVERFGMGQTPNPWYNVANQFAPRSLHDVIKWSRYITVQSPTVTEVIRKLSTYPITDFNVDSPNKAVREKYEEIFKSIGLKGKLEDAGFDHYTIGNVFMSIYFPILRVLKCPVKGCGTEHNAKTSSFAKWKKYGFEGNCPACMNPVKFQVIDRKSRDIRQINLVKWDPEHVSVNHNPITGESEYYYKIPNSVRRRIMLGDRLFIDSVPWGFIEAVRQQKDFKFDSENIFHMKNLSMGSMLEGLGLPPLISFYSLVFYQAVLRKANEAIATGYLSPMRAIFPQASSGAGDPVVSMSMSGFANKVEKALMKHKNDPNHILISPIPLGYQNLGGEGRSLLVAQEIDQAEKTMLLGLGVSMELLSGSTNWTSSTVGLRLLENTMNSYTAQIQEMISWVMRKIAAYLGIDQVDVTMTPFKLTDDMSTREIMAQLAQAGEGSFSTFYEAMGMDYKEELDKIKEDKIAKAIHEVETEQEVEAARFVKGKETRSEDEHDNGFAEAKNQAYTIAAEIAGAQYNERRVKLVEIMRQDESLARMVWQLLPNYGVDQETFLTREEEMVMQQQGMDPAVASAGGAEGEEEESSKPAKASAKKKGELDSAKTKAPGGKGGKV